MSVRFENLAHWWCMACGERPVFVEVVRRHMALRWDEAYEVMFCTCGEIVRCTDCGGRPAHRDSNCTYCRRCSEKGGDRESFFTRIDHDDLRCLVGEDLANRILADCKMPY